MNIYIAYKFTNIDNKQEIRDNVHRLAKIVEEQGHNTFILGRDLQKWEDYSHPLHHKMKTIFNQIRKADCIVAFVDSEVPSKGLFTELVIGRLLRKKVILAIKNGIKAKQCRAMVSEIVEFEHLEDLKDLELP